MPAVAQADLAPPPHRAMLSQIELEFDFYAGGIRVAKVTGGAQLHDERYIANAIFKSEGSLSDLFDVTFSFETVGLRSTERFDPQTFTAVYRGFEGDPTVTVTFSGADGPTDVEPGLPEDMMLTDFTREHHLIDPITAVLQATLLASDAPCNKTYDLFDGVRSYRLVLLEPKEDDVDSYEGSIYEGPAIRCRWRYELLTSSDDDWARDLFLDTPPEGRIWFANLKGVMSPVRLLAETPIINVVMHIMAARINNENVAAQQDEDTATPN
jgi:hypothetical protein